MSPSTKNLKERIWKILDQSNTWKESADKLESLLSSELSLAVKGLREAVEKSMTGKGVWCLEELCKDRTCETCKRGAWFERNQLPSTLSWFDAKAKEILGESS